MEELGKYRNQISKDFPSTSEISHIAAILAQGDAAFSKSPMVIADEAIELWNACESMRNAKIRELALYKFEAKKEAAEVFVKTLFPEDMIEIPTPKNYPVDFDEFLRLTIGGRHKAPRLKLYRDYAKHMIWTGHFTALVYPKNPADKISDEEALKKAVPAS